MAWRLQSSDATQYCFVTQATRVMRVVLKGVVMLMPQSLPPLPITHAFSLCISIPQQLVEKSQGASFH